MVLTEVEMEILEKRVDEIDSILDLCDERFDSDIIDNLIYELESIETTLRTSLNNLEKAS